MDKLDKIFQMQEQLDGYIKTNRKVDYSKEEWMQRKCMALIVEVSELLEELNYKWWKNPKPLDEANIKEELVDILHFFVSLSLSAGMSSDELFDIYMSKNKENHDRQDGKSKKSGYESKIT